VARTLELALLSDHRGARGRLALAQRCNLLVEPHDLSLGYCFPRVPHRFARSISK
jgi:hypothetical protein